MKICSVLICVMLLISSSPSACACTWSDLELGLLLGIATSNMKIGLLASTVLALAPATCELAKTAIRHKYVSSAVLAGAALCAIPQTRRIILSKLERHVPFFVPARKGVKHIAKTIGILALAAKYKVMTFFGVTINIPIKDCGMMIYDAISRGKTMAARAFIKAGANPNVQDTFGKTPLHVAVSHFKPTITQDLINAGANLDACDSLNVYPLYEAVRYRAFNGNAYDKQLRTVSILLKAGARRFVNSPNFNLNADKRDVQVLRDCLSRAIQNKDRDLLRALLEVGMSAVLQDAQGSTIMHQVIGAYNAAEPTPLDSLAKDIIRIQGQAAVVVRDRAGRTPLHLAAQYGNLRLAKLLLRNGASVNAQDDGGNSPLHCIENSQRMGEFLVTHGADMSLLNNNGESPVRYAPTLWEQFFRERLANLTVS